MIYDIYFILYDFYIFMFAYLYFLIFSKPCIAFNNKRLLKYAWKLLL